jgi:hypothetical protein
VCFSMHLGVMYLRGRLSSRARPLGRARATKGALAWGGQRALCELRQCARRVCDHPSRLRWRLADLLLRGSCASGFWAIVIWHDVRGLAVLMFTIASLITAVGATVLNLAIGIEAAPAQLTQLQAGAWMGHAFIQDERRKAARQHTTKPSR